MVRILIVEDNEELLELVAAIGYFDAKHLYGRVNLRRLPQGEILKKLNLLSCSLSWNDCGWLRFLYGDRRRRLYQ